MINVYRNKGRASHLDDRYHEPPLRLSVMTDADWARLEWQEKRRQEQQRKRLMLASGLVVLASLGALVWVCWP